MDITCSIPDHLTFAIWYTENSVMMIMIMPEAVILQDTVMPPLYTALHLFYNIFMPFYSIFLVPSRLIPIITSYTLVSLFYVVLQYFLPLSAIHPFPMHSVGLVREGKGTCEKCHHGNNVNRNRS